MNKFAITFFSLVIFAFSLAGAKGKPVNYEVLKFNWKTFENLSPQDQKKYLKGYVDLFIEIEKKKKKSIHSFLLDSLMMEAVADDSYFCFNGLLAYKTKDKAECKAATTVPAAEDGLFNCGADESRCSITAGVDTNGKGYCYKKSQSDSATARCLSAASAMTGTGDDKLNGGDRLRKLLDDCKSSSSDVCSKLSKTVESDANQLAAYCGDSGTGEYKAACNRAVNQKLFLEHKAERNIASAKVKDAANRKKSNKDDGKARKINESCIRSRNAIISTNENSKSNGAKAWRNMIGMASNLCAGRSIDKIQGAVGVCPISAMGGFKGESTINEIYRQMANHSQLDSDKVDKDLKEATGLNTDQFRQIFCADDTKGFLDAVKSVTKISVYGLRSGPNVSYEDKEVTLSNGNKVTARVATNVESKRVSDGGDKFSWLSNCLKSDMIAYSPTSSHGTDSTTITDKFYTNAAMAGCELYPLKDFNAFNNSEVYKKAMLIDKSTGECRLVKGEPKIKQISESASPGTPDWAKNVSSKTAFTAYIPGVDKYSKGGDSDVKLTKEDLFKKYDVQVWNCGKRNYYNEQSEIPTEGNVDN